MKWLDSFVDYVFVLDGSQWWRRLVVAQLVLAWVFGVNVPWDCAQQPIASADAGVVVSNGINLTGADHVARFSTASDEYVALIQSLDHLALTPRADGGWWTLTCTTGLMRGWDVSNDSGARSLAMQCVEAR